MARFRRSGLNHEGRPWRTPPSLNALLDRIEADFPQGNSSLDGTVASKGHDTANPASDHRPVPFTGYGIVRAVDAYQPDTETGDLFAEYLRALKDRRIKYVIWNQRMFASYDRPHRKAWEWGTYSGSNPHTRHAHVSFESRHDTDVRPFPPILTPEEDEMTLKRGDRGNAVSRYQQGLVAQGLLEKADGVFGPLTAEAVKRYQRNADLPQTGEIDGITGPLLLEWVADRVGGGLTVADVKGIIAQTKLSP